MSTIHILLKYLLMDHLSLLWGFCFQLLYTMLKFCTFW